LQLDGFDDFFSHGKISVFGLEFFGRRGAVRNGEKEERGMRE
jgi:hypothetical protein